MRTVNIKRGKKTFELRFYRGRELKTMGEVSSSTSCEIVDETWFTACQGILTADVDSSRADRAFPRDFLVDFKAKAIGTFVTLSGVSRYLIQHKSEKLLDSIMNALLDASDTVELTPRNAESRFYNALSSHDWPSIVTVFCRQLSAPQRYFAETKLVNRGNYKALTAKPSIAQKDAAARLLPMIAQIVCNKASLDARTELSQASQSSNDTEIPSQFDELVSPDAIDDIEDASTRLSHCNSDIVRGLALMFDSHREYLFRVLSELNSIAFDNGLLPLIVDQLAPGLRSLVPKIVHLLAKRANVSKRSYAVYWRPQFALLEDMSGFAWAPNAHEFDKLTASIVDSIAPIYSTDRILSDGSIAESNDDLSLAHMVSMYIPIQHHACFMIVGLLCIFHASVVVDRSCSAISLHDYLLNLCFFSLCCVRSCMNMLRSASVRTCMRSCSTCSPTIASRLRKD